MDSVQPVEACDTPCVGAVILAAGASSRMRSPKQILRFQGESLLRRAVVAALGAGCKPVIVVTGANAELSRSELVGLAAQEKVNHLWENGMSSSIRAGVEVLTGAGSVSSAAIFLVCDQPYVTSDVLSGLIVAHRATGKPIIASTYGESFGVPALFSSAHFAELARLEGGSGAKQIIKKHAAQAHYLPFPLGEVDMDTPHDFSRLLEKDEERQSASPTLKRAERDN